MLNFKVKHKLLLIWLGSIMFALMLMAGLFQYQLAGLHQHDARTQVQDAIITLHHELENIGIQAHNGANTLALRTDVVASMNMIDRYQDPSNYQSQVFDAEKRKLARELGQHATATGTDIVVLFDSDGVPSAYYLSPRSGGTGAGYISYSNGQPLAVDLETSAQSISVLPLLLDLHAKGAALGADIGISHMDAQHLVLSSAATVVRKRSNGPDRLVGVVVTGTVLGDSFETLITQASGMNFTILAPQDTLPGDMAEVSHALANANLPHMILNGNPSADHSHEHAWLSSERYFIGAVNLTATNEGNLKLLFTQRTDTLETTLQTFQNSMIVVLVVAGLLVLPIGIFFFNRTISRPVENLVECADQMRQGHQPDMATFSGRDEFSALARSFQSMSTAVRAREEALTESQERLKNAQRIARLGNWEWDLRTSRIYFSDEILDILGRTRAEIGDGFDALLACVHANDVRTLKRRISESIENGVPFTIEHRIILPTQEERFVLQRGEMLTDEGAEVVRINATMQDITERHMLELAKNDLISTVSHELRTPLTSITGALGLALGGALGELPVQLRGMLDTADKNAKRLSALINDLLDIEKIANGSMALDRRALNLAKFLRDSQAANHAYAKSLGVAIRIKEPIPDAELHGDEDRLSQVMANLLSNACKFTPEGERVTIQAAHDADTISISITDPGPGIPEAFEDQVFERFAQADQTMTRQDQKGGTGLGLAITKAIVEMHDGQVAFTTRREPDPDHGTTFTITLPEWNSEIEL